MRHLDPVSQIFLDAAVVMIALLTAVCAVMVFADWVKRRRQDRHVERCIRAARDEASAREGGYADFY